MPEKLLLSVLAGSPVYVTNAFTPELNRIYGGVYIGERGVWAFPAFYPFNKYVESDLEIALPGRLEWTQEAKDWAAKVNKPPTLHPDFKFHTTPYAHQREALLFALQNRRCGLLYDCGLGKTKCVIDLLRYLKQFEGGAKALVILPLVILYKWADEVTLHSGGELVPIIIDGTPKRKREQLATPGDVYLCTYKNSVSMAEDIVEKVDYNVIVVDESHNLQTYNAEKTKAATYLSRKAPRRILLSGTAALGDPRDLYGQLDFLGPFLREPSYFKFCDRYVSFQKGSRHKVVTGFKNLDILAGRLATVGLRRKKEDCLDLPERTFVTVPYKVSKGQLEAYNQLVTSSRSQLKNLLRVREDATAATRLIKMSQILSGYIIKSNKDPDICDGCEFLHSCVQREIMPYTKDCAVITAAPASTIERFKENPKLDALKGLLDMQLVNPTNKTIIWAHYLEELNVVESALTERGTGYVRVDGDVSAVDVQARVKQFQTDPECRVYVGQIAAGVGIDLTAANYTIYYSLDWNLANYLQSLDRNHRLGQRNAVTVYFLTCPDSIEQAVVAALQNKDDIRRALTDRLDEKDKQYMRLIARPEVLQS